MGIADFGQRIVEIKSGDKFSAVKGIARLEQPFGLEHWRTQLQQPPQEKANAGKPTVWFIRLIDL